VLDLIASARASLWMEMYLLSDARAIDALAARAQAGCDVRVALDPAPYGDETGNEGAFAALGAAGVAVRWSSPRFTYTHAKAFTVDHARLVVMTLNLSGAGLAGNREYVAVNDDRADVDAAEALFQADATGAAAGGSARVVTSPDGSRATLAALVAGATRTLDIETEELTDQAIVQALLAARARGVAVTLVWPGPAGSGAPFATLATAGVTVRATASPGIHAKTLVADQARAYVGSVNLSPTSLDANREIGLLLDGPQDRAVAAQLASTVDGDAGRGVSPAALY
jgi:phosphatidylserine/phosphatidylglycerophosphate/cardiolipin synthase-like enzyme